MTKRILGHQASGQEDRDKVIGSISLAARLNISAFGLVWLIAPVWAAANARQQWLVRTPPLAATKIKAEFITNRLAATGSLRLCGTACRWPA